MAERIKFNMQLSGTVNPYIAVAGTPGTVTFGKAPAAAHGGGVSIREAIMHSSAGTITVTLVDMGSDGLTLSGTVCTLTQAAATKAPVVGAPAGYWLAAGNYLAAVFPAGTLTLPASIDVYGVHGR